MKMKDEENSNSRIPKRSKCKSKVFTYDPKKTRILINGIPLVTAGVTYNKGPIEPIKTLPPVEWSEESDKEGSPLIEMEGTITKEGKKVLQELLEADQPEWTVTEEDIEEPEDSSED